MKQMLQKSDPFPLSKCGRRECVMCEKGMGTDCRTRGCVYEIECKEDGCGKKYIGMTGRSLFERMREHINGMVNGRESDDNMSNPLLRHKTVCHEGENVDVRVVDRLFGKPSRIIIGEAVRIESMREQVAMNGRREWSYLNLNRHMYGIANQL